MSSETLVYHSPHPSELGSVPLADLEALAAVNREIGAKHAVPNSWRVSPDRIDYKIEPSGGVSVITNIKNDYEGTWSNQEYTLQPATVDEGRLLVDALKPFVAAGQGWLHTDEAIIVSFLRSLQQASLDAGEWHADSTSAQEDFRALLFYDALPTQFAVGSLVLNTRGMEQPLTPQHMNQLLSSSRIRKGVDPKAAELVVVDGPAPLQAVGITHEHLHRAAAVPPALNDTYRTFLRLATVRLNKSSYYRNTLSLASFKAT